MRLTISATSVTANDEDITTWKVNLLTNGTITDEGLDFQDPLDRKGRLLVRWYLDKYHQRESFSVSKARSAESLLKVYGSQLVEQLDLKDRITGCTSPIIIEICNSIIEQPNASPSIQQLYWEFLENSQVWNGPGSIRVQRQVKTTQSPVECREHHNQIEIWLVTARDLSRNSTSDADISPCLVADILWDIKSKLNATSGADLKLKVVRPGTFHALKKQLEAESDPNSPKLIHFDLHGTVQPGQDGLVTGYLHFCDPHSDSTTPVSADDVSRLLQSHNISGVVLNACDSAVSRFGDDANVANVLVKQATSNVVAMVHSASESTTVLFLREFYASFLLDRQSFGDAATQARTVLRKSSLRDARFNRQVSVMDWTVPVVYSTGQELFMQLAKPEDQESTCKSLPMETKTSPVRGRDFDYLRVEKQVEAHGAVFVHGPPGIGKTCFLRGLASLWIKSHFIDTAVFVDLGTLPVSWDVFTAEGIRQRGVHDQKDWAQFVPPFSSHRVALMIDNWTENQEQNPFLRGLEMQHQRHQTLISGRTKPQVPLVIGDRTTSFYELKGLDKADAMFVVQDSIGSKSSSDIEAPRSQDAEPFIHLMQGNPAGIAYFSPFAHGNGISFLDLYWALLSQDPSLRFNLSSIPNSFPLMANFLELQKTLSADCWATWIMLSWYWHHGPTEKELSQMLLDADIVTRREAVTVAIQKAAQIGYLKQTKDGRISIIQPLFTLFCRITACSQIPTSGPVHSWAQFRNRFAASTMELLLPRQYSPLIFQKVSYSGHEYAVHLTKEVLSSHWATDLNIPFLKYLVPFFCTMNGHNAAISDKHVSQGRTPWDYTEDFDALMENLLFSLKLCRGTGMFPLPSACWPRALTDGTMYLVLHFGTCNQASTAASLYEEILQGVISYSKFLGQRALGEDDLAAALSIAATLSSIHRQHIPAAKNRELEFIELAEGLLKSHEREFGPPTSWELKASVAILHFAKAMALATDRKPEESRREMQLSTRCMEEVFELAKNGPNSRFQELLKEKSHDVAGSWKAFVKDATLKSTELEDLWELCLAEKMGWLNYTTKKIKSSKIIAAGHPISDVWAQMIRNHKKLTSTHRKYTLYEQEVDRGNWEQAISYHSGFILQSMLKLDMEQVDLHINEQERIAIHHDKLDENQNLIRENRDLATILRAATSGVEGKMILPKDIQKMKETFTRIASNRGVDVSWWAKVCDLRCESWERDHDPSLPHNAAPSIIVWKGSLNDTILNFLPQHGTKALQDNSYGRHYLHIMETLNALELAEDESDKETIYRLLNELHSISNEEHGNYLDQDGLVERRNWNTMRLCQPHIITLVEGASQRQGHGIWNVKQCLDATEKIGRVFDLHGDPSSIGAFSEILKVCTRFRQLLLIEMDNASPKSRDPYLSARS
ncbi:hypothetical protein B0J13DRAFT_676355 [Dactylonectria estremocensis]|uniref:CHAT domain-containing protein n=1 Tax=Dactylonectria estremocensis TaxID=1079267 RepID=A0A9P9EP60_9HYPO|nr:hypothetical protein B0J13DRAFT_676355 [Dactylonectria estremocensis]